MTTHNPIPIDELARMLLEAEEKREPIDPLTKTYPQISIEDAYRIQLKNVDAKIARGEKIVGKKIGLTSKGMQKLFGVNEPDYGHLTDRMIVLEGECIDLRELIQPKIEAEIAFVLKDDLKGPGITPADVLRATEGVMPALEIIDSRIRDWKIKIQDTIADNASSARFVLGGRIVDVRNIDLRLVGLVFEVNGEIISTAAGAAVMGNPVSSVAWLANKLASYGTYLKSGEVILSGSLIAAVDIKPGYIVRATFDKLGSVTIRFK